MLMLIRNRTSMLDMSMLGPMSIVRLILLYIHTEAPTLMYMPRLIPIHILKSTYKLKTLSTPKLMSDALPMPVHCMLTFSNIRRIFYVHSSRHLVQFTLGHENEFNVSAFAYKHSLDKWLEGR